MARENTEGSSSHAATASSKDKTKASGHYPARIKQLPLYDGRFDAYRMHADAADVLFASYAAGTRIPAHTHDTDNHGVITRGELILTMNGKTERFGPGDWYHVPAHVEHAAAFDVETDEVEFWFKADE
jgi:quercetin dioxygenase-like cupin family protein